MTAPTQAPMTSAHNVNDPHESYYRAVLAWSHYQLAQHPGWTQDPYAQIPPASASTPTPAPVQAQVPPTYQQALASLPSMGQPAPAEAATYTQNQPATTEHDSQEDDRSAHRPVVESSTAALTFYDLESLHNIFTLVLLTTEPVTDRAWVNIYHLIDDEDIHAQFTTEEGQRRLIDSAMANNPAMRDLPIGDRITIWDLRTHEANIDLATRLAISNSTAVHTGDHHNLFGVPLPVCDTHPDYDPTNHEHAICAGYNSANYDTVMLGVYFMEYFGPQRTRDDMRHRNAMAGANVYAADHPAYDQRPVKAATMRAHNDRLFSDAYRGQMTNYIYSNDNGMPKHHINKWGSVAGNFRTNMMRSGRHIDVSRLNEVQSMTSLERHLGQLGHQMLGFDNLSGDDARVSSVDDVIELLAYNVSDVVGLRLLFLDNVYSGAFDQRAKLMQTYPECIYNHTGDRATPDIRPEGVDKDRMKIDSSSAQFVARVLAPYEQLEDIPVVDYVYPHPEIAKEMGIEPFDVLEDTRKFFYDNIEDESARAQFDEIYNYYRRIAGKNYNPDIEYQIEQNYDAQFQADRAAVEQRGETFDFQAYQEAHPRPTSLYKIEEIERGPNNIPYFKADGTPSTGFVTFSYGGIHGAEYYEEYYNHDWRLYQESKLKLDYAKVMSGDNPRFIREAGQVTVPVGHPDGSTSDLEIDYKDVLVSGATKKNPLWREEPKVKEPILFPATKDGATKLRDKYYYTSMVDCIHEDFTSYYPLLLRNLRAFYNPALGEDRYSKIFDEKEEYDVLRKDTSYSKEERDVFNVLREGAKLLLNAASGAGNARHETNIRISNTIIKMRVIGQLFLWRIGQAQTLASDSAVIASTNTDGIYSAYLDWETNNRVLEEQVKSIYVDIEPEPLTLVSKDSNNRVEFLPAEDNHRENPLSLGVASAGGSLACHAGPNPRKRLQFAAMTPHALVGYFKHLSLGYVPEGENRALSMHDEADRDLMREIILRAHEEMETADLLTMYQTIIASSPGAYNYLYAADYREETIVEEDGTTTVRSLPADDMESLPTRNPRTVARHNRMFIVDPAAITELGLGIEPVTIAQAKAPKISPTTRAKRERDGLKTRARNEFADQILTASGVDVDALTDRDTNLGRYSGLDPATPVYLHNHSLRHPPRDAPITPEQLLAVIDTEAYVDLAVAKYESDWRNKF